MQGCHWNFFKKQMIRLILNWPQMFCGIQCCPKSKYEEAKVYIDQKYQVCEQRRDSSCMADMCMYLGNIHLQQGDFDLCFDYVSKSALLGKGKMRLQLLGTLYRYIGDYPTALDYYRKAFAVEMKKVINEHDCDIWTTTEFAELYAIVGEYDSARMYYKILDTTLMTDKDLRIYHTSIGEVYLLSKDYTKAIENFKSAIVHHLKRNDRSQVIRT